MHNDLRTTSKRALLVLLALLAALTLTSAAAARPLPSESRWREDVREAMAGSRHYLDVRIAEGGQRPLAINLDIDNSSIATEYDKGEAIPEVLRFVRKAHRNGVKIFFNTAREEKDRAKTRLLLRKAGYPVDRLCMRTSAKEDIPDSKQRCRQRFHRAGFTLIANVGNRETDFIGGGYERAFRLPNYDNGLS